VRRFSRQQFVGEYKLEHTMANEKQSGGSDRGGSGNFANDPQRASEAGKKGGSHSHSGASQQDQSAASGESKSSRQGGSNFSNDHEKASESGKKGGEHSHGGHKTDHKSDHK
jgi:general stress protein YciG